MYTGDKRAYIVGLCVDANCFYPLQYREKWGKDSPPHGRWRCKFNGNLKLSNEGYVEVNNVLLYPSLLCVALNILATPGKYRKDVEDILN